MTNTILIAIDIAEEASWNHALPEAVKLAQLNNAALHVLYVVPFYGSFLVENALPKGFSKTALSQALEQLKALVIKEVPAERGAKLHVRHGTVHSEILDAIKEVGADLVVMASHAPDHVREFLVGSQADRVVRRSPVSVLVVRA